jgi:hypothetical protein
MSEQRELELTGLDLREEQEAALPSGESPSKAYILSLKIYIYVYMYLQSVL